MYSASTFERANVGCNLLPLVITDPHIMATKPMRERRSSPSGKDVSCHVRILEGNAPYIVSDSKVEGAGEVA